MDVLLAHATEEPPPFAFVGAGAWVSPAIEEVVQACLAKDPADRPRNARDLAERYEAALAADAAAAAATVPRSPSAAGQMQQRPATRGKRLPAPPPQLTPAPGQQPEDPHQTPRPTAASRLPAAATTNPLAIVHQIDAWMPERIATYKLHGFIHDTGGEVLQSIPGCIRVRLGAKGSAYTAPRRGSFSWLGIGRGGSGMFDLEIHLQRPVGGRENQLTVTIVLHPPCDELSGDLAWREMCDRVFRDLRAYLMGQSGAVSADSVV
jgi:serine/threonine-protein kinase